MAEPTVPVCGPQCGELAPSASMAAKQRKPPQPDEALRISSAVEGHEETSRDESACLYELLSMGREPWPA